MLHNNHNVYILGAGFSAHAGFPLIKDFMNSMKDSLDWLIENERTVEIEAINKVLLFQQTLRSASDRVCLDVENIEELFSLAFSQIKMPTKDLQNLMAISIAAPLTFSDNRRNPKKCQIEVGSRDEYPDPPLGFHHVQQNSQYESDQYEFFLSVMTGRNRRPQTPQKDTIITFNYDLLVEEALHRIGIPCVYGGLHGGFLANFQSTRYAPDEPEMVGIPDPLPEDHVRLIKLHGSINWMLNPEHDPAASSPASQYKIVILDDYQATWKYQQNSQKSSPIPNLLLAPPTWNKDLRDLNAPLSNVWDAAVRAIETATRIIIVGYSMPQTDPHFKYLLAAGLANNISLRKLFFVNPDFQRTQGKEKEEEELKDRLFNVIRKHFQDLNRLELIDTTVQGFLGNPERRKMINRDFDGIFANKQVLEMTTY